MGAFLTPHDLLLYVISSDLSLMDLTRQKASFMQESSESCRDASAS